MNPLSLAAGLAATQTPVDNVKNDDVETVKFYSYFKGQNDLLENRQRDLWKPLFLKWLRHALYYDGKQTLIPRANGFGYDAVKLREKHKIYVINRLRPYSDDQTAMWMSVNPKIKMLISDTNEETQQRKNDAFNWLKDHFQYLNHTPEFLQKCAKSAQFCGPYHAEVWFDKDSRKGQEYIRNYQDVNVPAKQLASCMACQQVGPPAMSGQVPTCGSCGSPYVDVRDLPGSQLQIPGAEGWQKVGEVELIHDESWHRRYSLTVGVDLSPWLYHERDEVKETVKCQYGKLKGNYSDKAWTNDDMMHPGRIMRRAERDRTASPSAQSADYDDECILIQRFYYEPEMLHFVQLDAPVTTPSGFQIPAKTRLSEVFPNGMCIKTAPGLPYFLDCYPESHKKRFINGKYGITPGKQVAHGNDEAPDFNKYLNVLMSGAFDHTLKTLQPSMAVIEEVFPDGRLFNREDRMVKVQKSQLMNIEGGLQKAFWPITPPPLQAGTWDGIQFFGGELQRSTKSDTYLSSSDKNVDPNTATAVRVGEGRTIRANSLHLALFADFQKNCFVRETEEAKDHYGEMRKVSTGDEDANKRIERIVRSTDLQAEIRAYVEEGSYLPDLQLEKRAAYKEGADSYVGLVQIGADKQQALKAVNRNFAIDLLGDAQAERLTVCEDILDQARELIALGAANPMLIYQARPVDPMELGHEARMVWWQTWLSSPEAQVNRVNPLLRAVATLYIQAHAAAMMEGRAFMAYAANIGAGLIAPPMSAGINASEQKPAAPAPFNATTPSSATGDAMSSGAQNQQFASDQLNNNQPVM